MTALAAVFHRDGRPMERPKFKRVVDALRPFGTAQTEPWCDGPAALVGVSDKRFAAENALDGQPASTGASLLLFDGLLADRQGLISALGLTPRQAAQQADSALFACAWDRWGEEAALRVDGTFAAVVWAPRARLLTAVCSPLDAPPLYHAVDSHRAIVATAPRAIFAWGDLARRLDDAILASDMINVPGDGATCYRGVSALLPGESLTVSPKAARVRRYYDLAEHAPPIRLSTDADYVDAGGELLRNAVESAMRAPRTPAVLLSGGIDSSSVAVVALESLAARGDPARLISITGMLGSTGHRGEIRSRVEALAAEQPALDAHFVDAGGIDAEQSLQRLMELVEFPTRSAVHAPTICSYAQAAVETGRNVILDGNGGNNTLSYDGLAHLANLLRTGRLPSLLRESAGGSPGERLGRFSPLLHYGLFRNLPRRAHSAVRRFVFGRRGWSDYSAIHPEFACAHHVDERARASGFDPYVRGWPSVREALLMRWEGHVRRHLYRGVIRAGEAEHGVQFRSPFYSRPLVEWAIGLPAEQFLRDGQSRRLIRRIMAGRLPTEILHERRRVLDRDTLPIRDLPAARATLERWRNDPSVAERVDLTRLLRLLDALPQTPVTRRNQSDYLFIRRGLDHALAVGRFIRWAEGGSNWAQA